MNGLKRFSKVYEGTTGKTCLWSDTGRLNGNGVYGEIEEWT